MMTLLLGAYLAATYIAGFFMFKPVKPMTIAVLLWLISPALVPAAIMFLLLVYHR